MNYCDTDVHTDCPYVFVCSDKAPVAVWGGAWAGVQREEIEEDTAAAQGADESTEAKQGLRTAEPCGPHYPAGSAPQRHPIREERY